MKAVLILLAGLLLAVTRVSAQEGIPLGAGEGDVTALIREALNAPNAPESWAGLAQGLSNLGTQLPEGTSGFEAAIRVADSLAFSPSLDPVESFSAPVESSSALVESSSTLVESSSTPGLEASVRGWILAKAARGGSFVTASFGDPLSLLSLLGLFMGAWILIGRAWRTLGLDRRTRELVALIRGVSKVAGGRRSPTPQNVGQPKDPRALALALTEHGLPAHEVARQTGLAQDEVAVVLALRALNGAFGRSEQGHRRSA